MRLPAASAQRMCHWRVAHGKLASFLLCGTPAWQDTCGHAERKSYLLTPLPCHSYFNTSECKASQPKAQESHRHRQGQWFLLDSSTG